MNPASSSSQAPKHLDPSAQEFHPTTPIPLLIPAPLFPLLPQPPHPLIPYPLPPPPPTAFFHLIPPPPPPTTTNSPSRTLLLTSLPPYTTEHSVVSNMSSFGDIRAVEMDRVYDGAAIVHFYDLRDAQTALAETRAQHFDGLCPVWAQFIIPDALHSVHDPLNHGTIVIFNLDPHVSDHSLKLIFQDFGPVKEVRETPSKRKQKFLEYFDVRDAEKAAIEMNRKIIHGKQITVDFSRPGGGHGRRRWRIESDDVFQQSKIRQSQSTPASYREPARNITSANIDDTITPAAAAAATNAAIPRSRQQARRPTRTVRTTTTSCDDMNRREAGGGTDATVEDSMFSLGNVSVQNDRVLNTTVVRNVASGVWKKQQGLGIRNKRRLMDLKFMIKEDMITAGCGGDSRTTLMIKNIPNKYSQKLMLSFLDNHCAHCNDQIVSGGQDGSSAGGGCCLSSYDFVYLPMDFNNKCNVGYGFVNMTSPEATVRLYKDFHRKSWEVFNSRKICEVTYARVQGLQALKDHFRNSKFPSGSDEIFPVVFEPPRDGRRQMTHPQPIYGLTTTTTTTTGSSDENGSSSSVSSSRTSNVGGCYSNESSQGCVDEEFSMLRVEEDDVTEVVEHNGGVDEVRIR